MKFRILPRPTPQKVPLDTLNPLGYSNMLMNLPIKSHNIRLNRLLTFLQESHGEPIRPRRFITLKVMKNLNHLLSLKRSFQRLPIHGVNRIKSKTISLRAPRLTLLIKRMIKLNHLSFDIFLILKNTPINLQATQIVPSSIEVGQVVKETCVIIPFLELESSRFLTP